MGTQKKCIWSLVVYLVTLALFLAAFASDYWLYNDGEGIRRGLWQECVRTAYSWKCTAINLGDQEGWFQATAAFLIMALILAVASGACRIFVPFTATLDIITGVFILVAVIIFGVETDNDVYGQLDWSYGLATTTSVLFLLNGVVLAIVAYRGGCDMTSQLPCQTTTEA